MIRILFFIHDLGVGGAEKVLVNLINSMDHDEFDISLISLFGGGVNEKRLSSSIKYRSFFKHIFRGNIWLLKILSPKLAHRIFIKNRYDIEVSFLEGVAARIVSGCDDENTKLISWIHVQQKKRRTAAKAFLSYRESVQCYSKFDKTVYVSEDVERDFLDLYPSINPGSVLYNVNLTDEIRKMAEEEIGDQYLRSSVFNIAIVGKLEKNKGIFKAVDILEKLKKQGVNVQFLFLGNGSQKQSLQEYIKKRKLTDSAFVLGYQSNPYKYIAKSDILLCCSEYEGFSTAATEALILGVPVVTTPVAGMNELIGNSKCGIITDGSLTHFVDSITQLLGDIEYLNEYKIRAKKRGNDFCREKTVSRIENYFRDIIEHDYKTNRNQNDRD